jgi:hypothetical protein
MQKLITFLLFVFVWLDINAQSSTIKISKEVLQDKIRGGWAGQTIGVTFGGPYEFRYDGTFIADYQKLMWHDGLIKDNMLNNAGLYDDLYMDLTFVDVFEKYGLDAPVDSFANAFAHAGYMLWHANQAGRYNILNGIKPPQSGYWKNNPHADCIDYQIESDFAGLMSPAMPNTASAISDKIGHIMNYGDGWYGGVFVGALYTQTFISSDINYIINEALKTIPEQSEFYKCVHDVIAWNKQFPNDWKETWFHIQKKWANDVGCPEGVFKPFDIDAKVNAAYVATGLLYGDKDFTKSLEITARCGQDADCNPSTVGGILGALLGYEKIPAYWKQGLKESEDIDFKYTTMSLNDVYNIGFKHALENIKRNGGSENGDEVIIKAQTPTTVKFEKSFDGLYPVAEIPVEWNDKKDAIHFKYEGTGFVIRGETAEWNSNSDFIFHTELYVDGKLIEKPELSANYTTRRYEICWDYDLPKGKHEVQLKILNPSTEHSINNVSAIYYTNKPIDGMKENEADALKINN